MSGNKQNESIRSLFPEKNEYYLNLLRAKAEETGRLPKKSDFPVEITSMIKSLFGPWPWALEKAGLKESKQEARLEKNRERRERAAERRNAK